MAISGYTVWEARTTGSDTACSGGFNPECSGFATDGAATSANTASPVFTSASYTFVAGDVGAKLFIKSGTNWNKGWYEIASVSSGAATLSAASGEGVVYGGTANTTNGAASYIATTSDGVATTASPTGATWGIDYSQQNAAQFSFTDMVIDATTNTKFTSAAYPVGKNFCGNIIRITSGTGFTTGYYEVVSTSGTVATCDRAIGTTSSTGGNGYLGGALAGPQLATASGVAAGGNRIFIKSGSYTISSTTINVANGRISAITNSTLEGYETRRGDLGAKPVFTASGISSTTLLTLPNHSKAYNLEFNGASLSNVQGVLGNTGVFCYQISVKNCLNAFRDTTCYKCYAESCTSGYTYNSVTGALSMYSVAVSCTNGFNAAAGTFHYKAIAKSCTTGFSELTAASGTCRFVNCTAYNCTTGFSGANSASAFHILINCISSNNSGYGYVANQGSLVMFNCAGYSNTSGHVDYNTLSSAPAPRNYNFITLTSSPFVDTATNDFSLNDTAGGGAELKGIETVFPELGFSSFDDLGASQSEATGGGGGVAGGSFTFA